MSGQWAAQLISVRARPTQPLRVGPVHSREKVCGGQSRSCSPVDGWLIACQKTSGLRQQIPHTRASHVLAPRPITQVLLSDALCAPIVRPRGPGLAVCGLPAALWARSPDSSRVD